MSDAIEAAIERHKQAIEDQANASAMAQFDAGASDMKVKTQEFFQSLKDSVRPPHVGDNHRAFVEQLLKQAETAGLYKPEDA